MIAQKVSHYRILEKLGEGGMGEVYLAEDMTLGRRVAIKFLHPDSATSAHAKKRLLREARAAAALDHANICAIHEVSEADGHVFIVMQVIDGETLEHRMLAKLPDWQEVLEVALQIADALSEAHSHGVIHRDIKPQNIMLADSGRVKVLDFGLAKILRAIDTVERDAETRSLMTQPGTLVGTLPYMSPEQLRGEELDGRTDIFSFGIVVYEMLCGTKPFGSKSDPVTISAILTRDPLPLGNYVQDIPREFERVVRKCLEKERERRYQSSKELLEDLRRLKQNPTAEVVTTNELAPSPRHKNAAWRYGAIAALLVLAIAAGLRWVPWRQWLNWQPSVNPINSIAVLPLVNVGGDPNVDYLTEGLTDSLIDSLSQLPNMKVIAHTSVYRYRDKEIDPQRVGSALNVQTLLTGRVAQRGEVLSINIELVNARDRSYLWGEQYTRNLSDLVTLQKEIAWRVAQRLRARMSGEDERRVTRQGTQNTQALQYYAKGRYFWNKKTEEDLKKAIENFNQATQIDPNYALAYVGLAESYSLLSGFSGDPSKETFPKAKEAVKRALEIDPNLAEGHTALATIAFYYDWAWADAEKEFRRAIELNGNSATAHQGYAAYLVAMGRFDEGLTESRLAHELDPLSLTINMAIARTYYMARQYDKAIEQCRITSEIDPNFPQTQSVLGSAYERKGMYAEAVAAFNKANVLSHDENFSTAELGFTHGFAGKKDKASAALDNLLKRSRKKHVDAFDIALVYMSLGKKNEAFEWLGKAVDERSIGVLFFKPYPPLDSLRSDPRYQALLRRVGLS